MKILITGGAGFIGSRLAGRLVEDGHTVAVLDNLHPQVHGPDPRPQLPGCELRRADVRDPDAVAQALTNVEVVYHLAAETGVGQSQYEIGRYVSTNSYGTAVVLEKALEAGVSHVVIASSRAVYGEGRYACSACGREFAAASRLTRDLDDGTWEIPCPSCSRPATPLAMTETTAPAPTSIYGITKLQQEQLASCINQARGLPVTLLRLFNVFGPGQSLSNPYVGVIGTFFRRALSGAAIDVYEDGTMQRDFVFVGDAVEALQRTGGNPAAFGRTLNVGTGRGVSLLEVARAMAAALQLPSNINISGQYRVGDVRHAVADARELAATLGYQPQTSFDEGLQAFVAWARQHLSSASDQAAERELTARNLLRRAKP